VLSPHITRATCISSDLSEADRGENRGAPTQAWAKLATAETLGGVEATKAAGVACAIIAAATCTAAVSGSQEAVRPGSGRVSGNALLHVTPDSKGSSDQSLPVQLGEMRSAWPTVQRSSTMYVQTCSTWH
jgi:hypothetical protein